MTDSESAKAVVEAGTEEQAKDIALNEVDRDKLTWTRNNDFESETVASSVEPAGEYDEFSTLEDIDTSDIPEAGEEFFKRAKLVKPQVTDVIELTPITPCTRVEVLIEGEEPDTLTLSALFYDQASINFSSQLDLVAMMQALADEGEYRTDFLTGYGSPATIRLKE
jgi:hypothetical protein